jgi:hypothetical protein
LGDRWETLSLLTISDNQEEQIMLVANWRALLMVDFLATKNPAGAGSFWERD